MSTMLRMPVLVFSLGLAGAILLGLTTYTLPNTGIASYPGLSTFIADALHDTSGALPAGPFPGRMLTLDSASARRAGPENPTAVEPAAALPDLGRLWARQAAERDSVALRRWLGHGVWGAAVTSLDTIRVTVHRLMHRPDCPWFNTLSAVYVRSESAAPRVVRLESTCPMVRVPPSASTGTSDR